ncbi:hypothetical protein ACFFX0_03585 [Citricoccus parietis]|uniref:Uncharacterized protein n=1 Tax=Citricoccus parietis TaxID=592307 RepID=A0ABV5FUH2_9MICC
MVSLRWRYPASWSMSRAASDRAPLLGTAMRSIGAGSPGVVGGAADGEVVGVRPGLLRGGGRRPQGSGPWRSS